MTISAKAKDKTIAKFVDDKVARKLPTKATKPIPNIKSMPPSDLVLLKPGDWVEVFRRPFGKEVIELGLVIDNPFQDRREQVAKEMVAMGVARVKVLVEDDEFGREPLSFRATNILQYHSKVQFPDLGDLKQLRWIAGMVQILRRHITDTAVYESIKLFGDKPAFQISAKNALLMGRVFAGEGYKVVHDDSSELFGDTEVLRLYTIQCPAGGLEVFGSCALDTNREDVFFLCYYVGKVPPVRNDNGLENNPSKFDDTNDEDSND